MYLRWATLMLIFSYIQYTYLYIHTFCSSVFFQEIHIHTVYVYTQYHLQNPISPSSLYPIFQMVISPFNPWQDGKSIWEPGLPASVTARRVTATSTDWRGMVRAVWVVATFGENWAPSRWHSPGVLSCFLLIGKVRCSNNLWLVPEVFLLYLGKICAPKRYLMASEGKSSWFSMFHWLLLAISFTLPETNIFALKLGRISTIVFQPSILRCENASFRQGIPISTGKDFIPLQQISTGKMMGWYPWNGGLLSLKNQPLKWWLLKVSHRNLWVPRLLFFKSGRTGTWPRYLVTCGWPSRCQRLTRPSWVSVENVGRSYWGDIGQGGFGLWEGETKQRTTHELSTYWSGGWMGVTHVSIDLDQVPRMRP